MTSRSTLGRLKDVADATAGAVVSTVGDVVMHPVGTGRRVVGHAVGKAVGVAGAVVGKAPSAPGRRPTPADGTTKIHGDPVAPASTLERPAAQPAAKPAAKKLVAVGEPEIPTPDETALGKKAVAGPTAKKIAPKKIAPKKKQTAKNQTAKKQTAKKPAGKNSGPSKTAAEKTRPQD